MVDEGIFATTAEVSRKAGANASSTANVEAFINQFMTEAEALINVTTRFNFSDQYSSLNVDVQGILKMVASNLAAMQVIMFDMSGFTSLTEAETMLDVLRDAALRGLSILRDKKQETFMKAA